MSSHQKLIYTICMLCWCFCGLQAMGIPPPQVQPLPPMPPMPPMPHMMNKPCVGSSQCPGNECCKASSFKGSSGGGFCAPVGMDNRQCIQDSGRSCYSDQQCQYNGCCVQINPYAIPSCIYDPYICSMKNRPPSPQMPPFIPPPPPPPPPQPMPYYPPPQMQYYPPPQIQYVYPPPPILKKCSHSFECGRDGCCFYDDFLKESRCLDKDGRKEKDDRPFPFNLFPSSSDDRPFPFNLLPRNSNASGSVSINNADGGNPIAGTTGNMNGFMNMNDNNPTGRKSSSLSGLLPLLPLLPSLFKYPPSIKCIP